MIPNRHPYCALFTLPGGRAPEMRSVVAWDDDGHPMVVGHQGLIRAEDCGDFQFVTEEDAPVVAAVPAGGWLVETTHEGRTHTEPVLAWAIRADHSTVPLVAGEDGSTGDVRHIEYDYRVYHPEAVTRTVLPDAQTTITT